MIVPVILSGGSGTRLWPLSRKDYPKQFLNLVNNTSLFQDTVLRLPDDVSDPLIICNEEHRFIVAEQLRQINSENKGIILEPVGKNTAPAIAIAAINLNKTNEDPLLLVLSADHDIDKSQELLESIRIASKIANQGKMVALGVKPKRPETGYGYIEVDNTDNNEYFNIISFKEKPGIKIATNYFNSGKHFWNSGIFIFKASVYLEELKKYEPEIYNICQKSYINTSKDLEFIRLNNDIFQRCPVKSIDYAVMEKTNAGVVVPLKGSWSDVGSWEAIWDSKSKDSQNNVCQGDTITNRVKNSMIYSSNRLIVANNISDLIVIDTPDALLVSSKENSQDIKHIVDKLKKDNRSELNNCQKIYRPWGFFDIIDYGIGFQIKRICLNSGAKLSLKKHEKRSEHLIVVKGIAEIICGSEVFKLKINESIYIQKGEKYRLENNEKTQLEIIEIQTGEYLSEGDFVRLEED
jgi:mannose-1-phosphate guanylyltransferase